MIFLGVVSSPFQLMCLNEFLILNETKKYIIHSYYDSQKEKSQLKEVINFLSIDNVKLIRAIRGFQYIYPYLFSCNKKIDTLIIGNYFTRIHRLYQKLIKSKRVILVDDGSISLNLKNSFKFNKVSNPYGNTNRIDEILGIENHFKFEIFTIFNLKPNKYFSVHSNELSYVRAKVKKFKKEKSIVIIGQPLVEKKFTDVKCYMDYLSTISKKFDGYNIFYFPSRKESVENILNIQKKFGFSIKNSEINIELYLIKYGILPDKIIGITTSALFSLSKIFEKIQINTNISFYRLKNFKNISYSIFSKKVYKEFEKFGIEELKWKF